MNKFTFNYYDAHGDSQRFVVHAISIQDAANQWQLAEIEAERLWHGDDKFAPDFPGWELKSVLDHGLSEYVATV